MLTEEGKPIVPRFRTPQEIRDDHLKRWNADAKAWMVPDAKKMLAQGLTGFELWPGPAVVV